MSNFDILPSLSENTDNPCKYVRSKARVFFVRHGKSVEDTEGKDSPPQSNGAVLKHIGKRQAQAAGKYLKIAGVTGVNNSINYGDDTIRVIETVDGIVSQLIQGDKIKKNPTDALRTTKKGLADEERLMENGEVFIATVGLMKQIRERVNKSLESATEFILVGHKSNKSGSEQATDNTNKAIDISFNIEHGKIFERDINADTGKYIDPKKHPETLFLNRYNYKTILKFLKGIPELNSAIQSFYNNTKSKSERLPIWELQNQINEFFFQNPTLFSYYFTQESSPSSLRIFCLANLLKSHEYSTIGEYYLTQCELLSDEEKQLILQNIGRYEMKMIFQELFISRKNLWSDSDKILIDRYCESGFYKILKSNQNVFEQAVEFQETHSVDQMIQDSIPGAIRSRNTYALEIQKKSDPLRGDESQEIQEVHMNFREILQSGRKYILRAHVGQGKSFWITEFIKYATQQDTEVVFLEASSFLNKSPQKIKETFTAIQKRGAILCIDAIDEIIENKEEIKQLITDFTGPCVITARPSEYPKQNTGFTTLFLRPLNTEDFLQSRFQGQEQKLQNVRKILEENHLDREVEGNPLLLTFVVLLAKIDEEKLKGLRNKADLYENVVRFILAEHTKKIKKHTLVSVEELDGWMNKLGQYAYDIFSNTPQKNTDTEFDVHLSVLFKNITKGQYEFIHKSFYEFFLARHLSKIENNEGSQKIYDFRDEKKLGNWNHWRDFRPVVLFYGESLANEKRWNELAEFLGENGLGENDDIFGENFFMGLEILYNLPIKEKLKERTKHLLEKYEVKMGYWDMDDLMKRYLCIKRLLKNIIYHDNKLTKKIMFILNHALSKSQKDGNSSMLNFYRRILLDLGIFEIKDISWEYIGLDYNDTRVTKNKRNQFENFSGSSLKENDYRDIMITKCLNELQSDEFFLLSRICEIHAEKGSLMGICSMIELAKSGVQYNLIGTSGYAYELSYSSSVYIGQNCKP